MQTACAPASWREQVWQEVFGGVCHCREAGERPPRTSQALCCPRLVIVNAYCRPSIPRIGLSLLQLSIIDIVVAG